MSNELGYPPLDGQGSGSARALSKIKQRYKDERFSNLSSYRVTGLFALCEDIKSKLVPSSAKVEKDCGEGLSRKKSGRLRG